jgi:ATP-dependent protease ClpP protease subunit
MRYATTNSIISFSQLEHDEYTMSDLTDATSLLKRLKRDNQNMMQYFSKCVKKTYQSTLKTFEKSKYFDAKEALGYGIIDKVIGKSK